MQTELYSLSKVFTENLFRIPDYQRGYSWGERQLKDFWADLLQLEEGRDHYTGVLTLEEVDKSNFEQWADDAWIIKSKRYMPYYVVDGQQRLTTSLILLQCIVEASSGSELNYTSVEDIRRKFIFESRDKGLSRSYIFGYEKDNPSYEYLKTRIFLEPSDSYSAGEQTIYTQNLSAAKDFFADKIRALDIFAVEKIFTRLTQHFLFNIYVISGAVDVFVAFETMNNRGKPLSHLELLKNRLIFLSTRLEVDDTERHMLRKVVNESWKTAYHFLGRNQKRPLDDDHFLSVQFLLYAGPQLLGEDSPEKSRSLWRFRRDSDVYKRYLLDEYFTPRNLANSTLSESTEQRIVLNAEVLYKYAHDLKKTVEIFYRLLNPDDSSFSDGVKIFLERLRRLGWREALPLAAAAVSRGTPESTLLTLLQRIERYLFVQLIRMHFDHEVNLLAFGVGVAAGKETVESVSNKIHDYSESLAGKIDFADMALSWARGRGYYGWRGLKYFLFEYEQVLKGKARSRRDKLIWEEFVREDFENDYSTIEHIYPQRARAPYWTHRFNSLSTKQRSYLRNSLGNLLAVSRPKNSALSNRPFPEKREGIKGDGGYRAGSYSEIEVAKNEDWTPERILDRGLKLLEFLEKRWSLKVGNDAKKIATLRIGFIGASGAESLESDDDNESAEP